MTWCREERCDLCPKRITPASSMGLTRSRLAVLLALAELRRASSMRIFLLQATRSVYQGPKPRAARGSVHGRMPDPREERTPNDQCQQPPSRVSYEVFGFWPPRITCFLLSSYTAMTTFCPSAHMSSPPRNTSSFMIGCSSPELPRPRILFRLLRPLTRTFCSCTPRDTSRS